MVAEVLFIEFVSVRLNPTGQSFDACADACAKWLN